MTVRKGTQGGQAPLFLPHLPPAGSRAQEPRQGPLRSNGPHLTGPCELALQTESALQAGGSPEGEAAGSRHSSRSHPPLGAW